MTKEALPPAPPPPQPKADPEILVLRGRPTSVIRFRRSVIVAIAALGSTAIIVTAWLALRPPSFHFVADGDQADIGAQTPTDALADAPKSYGDVPQLGPPLPGDLGKPILNHERALGETAPGEQTDRAAQAAEAERQRIAAERKAARDSGVMMQLAGTRASALRNIPQAAPVLPEPEDQQKQHMAFSGENNPDGQQQKNDFLIASGASGDVNSHGLSGPVSPYMLMAGSIIPASLITGLNSDLPGLVTAQVTENVYDSVTGEFLLIPQGSRLIGSYDSEIAFGQNRALVVWQRIILPDGSSVRIDSVPATDTAGYAGLADKVDLHSWQLLKGVALSTLLGVGTQLSLGNESDLVRALREATQQSASRAGDQIVMKNLDVQPAITVRPGWPLRVVVHKDIVLRPWLRGGL